MLLYALALHLTQTCRRQDWVAPGWGTRNAMQASHGCHPIVQRTFGCLTGKSPIALSIGLYLLCETIPTQHSQPGGSKPRVPPNRAMHVWVPCGEVTNRSQHRPQAALWEHLETTPKTDEGRAV